MARLAMKTVFIALVTATGTVAFAAPSLGSGTGSEACVAPAWSIGERVCAGRDGWQLEVGGRTLFTHGPDPVGLAASPGDNYCVDDESPHTVLDNIPYLYHCENVPPTCVDGDPTEHYLVAIYARPSDGPDRYASIAPQIRDSIAGMNGIIHYEASLFNVEANLYALCEDDVIVVHDETLTTTQGDGANIMSDIVARYDAPNEKYIVFYDDDLVQPSASAMGLKGDDSPNASNPQNGVGYALLVNWLHPVMFAHEYGHLMGAVKPSAPHVLTSHCWDGQDIMCYDDRALTHTGNVQGQIAHYTTRYIPVMCVDLTHFDCGHDDYFHPAPPAGSYLATHWNIGSPNNLYIEFS